MNQLPTTCPHQSSRSLRHIALPVLIIATFAVLWKPSTLIAQDEHKATDNPKPKVQWTQFRGTGNGHADPAAHPPASWDASQIAWETEVPGTGWSSPVYQNQDKHAWLTAAVTTTLSGKRDRRKGWRPESRRWQNGGGLIGVVGDLR